MRSNILLTLMASALCLSITSAGAQSAMPGTDSSAISGLGVRNIGSAQMSGRIAAIAGRIAASGANIDRIGRLAHRPVTCIEFEVSGADPDGLRTALARESLDQRADVAVQRGGL